MIGARLIRGASIHLLLRLSCILIVSGITTSTNKSIVSVIDNRVFKKTPENPPEPSRNLEVPSRVDRQDERSISEFLRIDGAIPRDWRQESRQYLPPFRYEINRFFDHSYGPPNVLPIDEPRAQVSSSPRYSRVTLNTHSPVLRLQRDGILWKNENRDNAGWIDDDNRRNIVEHARIRPGGNIRPVYELEDDFVLNDEDHRRGKNQPAVNRPIVLSSNPNTVTPHKDDEVYDHVGSHRSTNERVHESTRDSGAAGSSLDWFLTKDGYNSPLHPPPNPRLSLILSHYGRHVSGIDQPKYYSYMAVNNIHNNRPFGQYKFSCDDDGRSID